MKKLKFSLKFLLPFIALAVGVFFAPIGCQRTLDPSGVYKGDQVLYEADNAIVESHALIQDFITWEANNRAALAQWPEIRLAADKLFKEGPGWFAHANALKEAYKANPNADNKTALQISLDIIKSAIREVSAYYAKKPGPSARLDRSPSFVWPQFSWAN